MFSTDAPHGCIISFTWYYKNQISGRHGSLMVSALVSGSSGPGSSPGQGTWCCVLGQGTLLSVYVQSTFCTQSTVCILYKVYILYSIWNSLQSVVCILYLVFSPCMTFADYRHVWAKIAFWLALISSRLTWIALVFFPYVVALMSALFLYLVCSFLSAFCNQSAVSAFHTESAFV